MKQSVLKVHPQDNVIVALTDLKKGETVSYDGRDYLILDDLQAKHKFLATDLNKGAEVIMYGVLVGKVQEDLKAGNALTTANLKHAALGFETGERKTQWQQPDISKWKDK